MKVENKSDCAKIVPIIRRQKMTRKNYFLKRNAPLSYAEKQKLVQKLSRYIELLQMDPTLDALTDKPILDPDTVRNILFARSLLLFIYIIILFQ